VKFIIPAILKDDKITLSKNLPTKPPQGVFIRRSNSLEFKLQLVIRWFAPIAWL